MLALARLHWRSNCIILDTPFVICAQASQQNSCLAERVQCYTGCWQLHTQKAVASLQEQQNKTKQQQQLQQEKSATTYKSIIINNIISNWFIAFKSCKNLCFIIVLLKCMTVMHFAPPLASANKDTESCGTELGCWLGNGIVFSRAVASLTEAKSSRILNH